MHPPTEVGMSTLLALAHSLLHACDWSSLGSSTGHLCGRRWQHVDGASPLPRGLLRDCQELP